MIRSALTLLILSVSIVLLQAQFPDNNWILGYGSGIVNPNGFGLTMLDFSNNQLNISNELEIDYELAVNNTSICTQNGALQFYFNGKQIFNRSNELMENGDSMYLGPFSLGYDYPQSSLIIPAIDKEHQYYIFTTYTNDREGTTTTVGDILQLSIVNMLLDEGMGGVVVKNQLLADDDFEIGKITAIRHANGRDWWIIWKYFDTNVFLRFLLTPEGVERLEDQQMETNTPTGLGQAVFSPDGSKYCIFNTVSSEVGIFVNIYDFDRCRGLMSNPVEMHFSHDGGAGGAAISPNSRFLYIPSRLYIYQFDLWAEDIEASKDTVAIYDGFLDPWLPTTFFLGSLARDGKIYISANNGVQSLTVIDKPDEKGVACQLRQHAVELPVFYAFGIPTFPNYRLGPIDGSLCDSLGINNIPLSNFRSDQDTTNYLSFYFQDLSAYEPSWWEWSFGDGSMSHDTSAMHQYLLDGVYEVCLTVGNEYGSHTSCDSLYLGTVNTSEQVVIDLQPQLFPNPFKDQFSFVLNDYYPKHGELRIFDGLGRPVHHQRIFQGWNTVDGSEWVSGVYFWEFWDRGVALGQGKVVCSH